MSISSCVNSTWSNTDELVEMESMLSTLCRLNSPDYTGNIKDSPIMSIRQWLFSARSLPISISSWRFHLRTHRYSSFFSNIHNRENGNRVVAKRQVDCCELSVVSVTDWFIPRKRFIRELACLVRRRIWVYDSDILLVLSSYWCWTDDWISHRWCRHLNRVARTACWWFMLERLYVSRNVIACIIIRASTVWLLGNCST